MSGRIVQLDVLTEVRVRRRPPEVGVDDPALARTIFPGNATNPYANLLAIRELKVYGASVVHVVIEERDHKIELRRTLHDSNRRRGHMAS